jgi:hypothetical protein
MLVKKSRQFFVLLRKLRAMITGRLNASDEGNIDGVESNVTGEKGKFSEKDFVLVVSHQPKILTFNPTLK